MGESPPGRGHGALEGRERIRDGAFRHAEGEADEARHAESDAGHREDAFALEDADEFDVVRDRGLREEIERSGREVELESGFAQDVGHHVAAAAVEDGIDLAVDAAVQHLLADRGGVHEPEDAVRHGDGRDVI